MLTSNYTQLINCQGSFELNIFQPSFQTLLSNSSEANPYFDESLSLTYFTYGVMVSSLHSPYINKSTKVKDFLVSIPNYITVNDIKCVEELLDLSTSFKKVNFQLISSNTIEPPIGFKYLKINIDDGLVSGSSALYRITLKNEYKSKIISKCGGSAFVLITSKGATSFQASSLEPFTFPYKE